MADNTNLIPAAELAAKNKVHFPNESPEYRQARNDLLSAEIELRRTSSASQHSAAPFLRVVKSRKTMSLKAPMERFAFHSCSATRIRWLSIA